MTQVDFYILKDDSTQNRLRFACRLTDKIYKLGKQIFIHTESAEQTRQLDDLLWTFQQGSFIPHCVHHETSGKPPAVVLAHDAEPEAGCDVLVNLAAEVPLYFSQFERVAELVNQQDDIRQHARTRYSFYKERGYPLQTHEINR